MGVLLLRALESVLRGLGSGIGLLEMVCLVVPLSHEYKWISDYCLGGPGG